MSNNEVKPGLDSLQERLADARRDYEGAEYVEDIGLTALSDAISIAEGILHFALEDRRKLAIALDEMKDLYEGYKARGGHVSLDRWIQFGSVVDSIIAESLS